MNLSELGGFFIEKNMIKNNAIAILGGMGPSASVYLYDMLIKLSAKLYGAKNNDDYPEIILHSIPIPDFISSDEKQQEALLMLQERIRLLSQMNISCFSIACNTAHLLLEKLQSITPIPFISMTEVVIQEVQKKKLKRVGILGAPSNIRAHLYQNPLNQLGIQTIIPNEIQLKELELVIRNVIAGIYSTQDTNKLIAIAKDLEKSGAEGIILGCTELPLVFPKTYTIPVFNSVEILCKALLQNYYGSHTIGRIYDK
jgi:aspartate racemase